MKEKNKFAYSNKKGITLIALVITIIVLLILAGVSIATLSGDDGLLKQAQSSKTKTEEAQKKEEEELNSQKTNIDNSLAKWTQNGNIITKGTITLKVGDVVEYDETNDGKVTDITEVSWKVLGVSGGKLALVSTDNVSNLTLNGKTGYVEGISEINKICGYYGNGKGASNVRGITVEDINRVTGYDPNKGSYDSTTGTYNKFRYGLQDEYLTTVTGRWYHFNSDGEFVYPAEGESVTLTSNYYSYFPTTLAYNDTDPEIGLDTDSEEYKLLFENSDGTDAGYWLADQFTRIFSTGGYINYGLRVVNEKEVQREYLVGHTSENSYTHGIRVVVELESGVSLEKDETTGSWKIK